jgi:hypothetical protein
LSIGVPVEGRGETRYIKGERRGKEKRINDERYDMHGN